VRVVPFCRECAKQVEDDWVSCPFCGAAQGSVPSSEINVQDSAVTGGIHQTTNVTQNTPEHLGKAIGVMLKELGFSGQSSPAELTQEQTQEVEKVLEVAEQAAGHGIEIDPWTEMALGKAARLAGRAHTAQQHYLRALETFRKNGDRGGEAASLNNLGNIAETRGDLAEAERLHRESLAIKREIGDRGGEANSLINLAVVAQSRGDGDEQRRLNTQAVAIRREIGIPIDQWFIDNGY